MLLWADGFDHYGLDETNMLDGVYASVGSCTLREDTAATGPRCIQVSGDNFLGDALRKVLPATVETVGVIARFYFPALPAGTIGGTIFNFVGTQAGSPHLSAVVSSTGSIRFLRGRSYFTLNGENGTLIAESDPCIVANAWNHVEIQVRIHNTLGWVRVAVNGVHIYQATGLDTSVEATACTSISHNQGMTGEGGSASYYMDDLQIYDPTDGDPAVDTDWAITVDGSGICTGYIGELGCYLEPPNADTAETDWVRVSGTNDFEMVNENTPDDATYISATAAGDLSEFEMSDLPEEITYIRGVQLIARMSKADAGACFISYGMNSNGTVEDTDDFPITVEPTYWWKFMNVDPDSGGRWTRAKLNAAKFRLTRTV